MNGIPNQSQGQFYYEPMAYPPYYYQPIVPAQPQMFLKNRMAGPKLANTLRTAQKTINTASRIIPLIYQIQPVVNNARTVLKVAKAIKSADLDAEPSNNEGSVPKNENTHNPYLP